MNIVTEIANMRSDLERLQQRIEARLAGGITEDDPVIARMIGRKVELERAIGVIEQLQAQLTAAKRGMDSAKDAGTKMMAIGKKLAAENSPEAIESEREANAVLTAENERLQAEVERLRKHNDELQRYNVGFAENELRLKQERDRLKAELERYSMSAGAADQFRAEAFAIRQALGFDKYGDDIAPTDLLSALDRHDAEVIERAIEHFRKGYINRSIHWQELQEYANQLRQKAKEVQS